ncbi:MAG: PilZ domain-containing protein [Planctomycetes bacterium]|nr:PilZ domain-containing protein [Planctomycetota bacterium]
MARRGKEQRHATRFNVEDVSVEFTERNLFSFFSRAKVDRQPLIDLSVDGLQFVSEKKLPEGEILKMAIKLPGADASMNVRGQVRWIQQIPGQELYRNGIQIVSMDQGCLDAIDAYISEQSELAVRVLCNSCGAPFKAKRKLHGKQVKCPKCGQVITIETEKPKTEVGRKSVHVSAPGGVGVEEVRRMVGQRVFMFLKQSVRSRLHLAMIEHMARSAQATKIFTPKDVATALGQSEKAVNDVLKDLAAQGITRAVGKNTYNYGPGKTIRECINELRRLSMKQNVRSAILSFVFSQEKKR